MKRSLSALISVVSVGGALVIALSLAYLGLGWPDSPGHPPLVERICIVAIGAAFVAAAAFIAINTGRYALGRKGSARAATVPVAVLILLACAMLAWNSLGSRGTEVLEGWFDVMWGYVFTGIALALVALVATEIFPIRQN